MWSEYLFRNLFNSKKSLHKNPYKLNFIETRIRKFDEDTLLAGILDYYWFFKFDLSKQCAWSKIIQKNIYFEVHIYSNIPTYQNIQQLPSIGNGNQFPKKYNKNKKL